VYRDGIAATARTDTHCMITLYNATCNIHVHTQLKRLCLVFAKQHDTPAGLYPHTVFSMVGIEDSSKLTLRICFRQKSNWQIGIKKWAIQVCNGHQLCSYLNM
jgi:hypothetical protein